MSNLSLKVQTRKEIGKKVNQIRQQGKIPAVLYGHKIKPVNLAVEYLIFEKLFAQAGESTLIDLVIDDQKPVKVLVQDYQLDPESNRLIHIDFHQVRMDEKLHTEIGLKFVGEAPAVKELGGILVTNIDALEVECLPQNLVHEIEVDLSSLNNLDEAITVADIKIPPGITVLNVPGDMVVLIQPPRSEKELADLEAKPETPEIPVEAEEKIEATSENEQSNAKEE